MAKREPLPIIKADSRQWVEVTHEGKTYFVCLSTLLNLYAAAKTATHKE